MSKRKMLSKKDNETFKNILIDKIEYNIESVSKTIHDGATYHDYDLKCGVGVFESNGSAIKNTDYEELYDIAENRLFGIIKEVIRDRSGELVNPFISDYAGIIFEAFERVKNNSVYDERIGDYPCWGIIDEVEIIYASGEADIKFSDNTNVDKHLLVLITALIRAYECTITKFCADSTYNKYKDWYKQFMKYFGDMTSKYDDAIGYAYSDDGWNGFGEFACGYMMECYGEAYIPSIIIAAAMSDGNVYSINRKYNLCDTVRQSMLLYNKLIDAYNGYTVIGDTDIHRVLEDICEYYNIMLNLYGDDWLDEYDYRKGDEEVIEEDPEPVNQMMVAMAALPSESELESEKSEESTESIGKPDEVYTEPETIEENEDAKDYAEECQDEINEKDRVDIDALLASKEEDGDLYDAERERDALDKITKKIKKKEIEKIKGITRNYFHNCKEREKFNSTMDTFDYKMTANYRNIATTSIYDFDGHHSIRLDNLSAKQYKAVIKSLITIIKKGIR